MPAGTPHVLAQLAAITVPVTHVTLQIATVPLQLAGVTADLAALTARHHAIPAGVADVAAQFARVAPDLAAITADLARVSAEFAHVAAHLAVAGGGAGLCAGDGRHEGKGESSEGEGRETHGRLLRLGRVCRVGAHMCAAVPADARTSRALRRRSHGTRARRYRSRRPSLTPISFDMPLTRRDFIARTAAAAASLSLTEQLHAATLANPVITPATGFQASPIRVISSTNGLRGVARAYEMLQRGEDTLDAIIAGVNITELDPEDDSVGLGGLPNEDGVVQLDASCMHGPTRRAGSVGCIEGIATPSLVAKAVMDYTDHIMLVGDGAKKFALEMGFKEQNLLTERSRQNWLRWRARLNGGDFRLDYDDDVAIRFTHGTINMNCVNAAGDMSSVTTTSGMAYKVPGRVGDSPIIGAGQYCDQTVGAAGSTGRGEANIKACGAFLTVELMRTGLSPEQAALKALERIVAMTETRLLNDKGRPRFDLNMYALHKDGRYGSASIYEGGNFAVADDRGARVENAPFLFKRSEYPSGPTPTQRARAR